MKKVLAFVMIVASVLSCITACKKTCETCQFGEWETISEATCSAEGQLMRVCSVCGNKETKEIETIEHTYGEWNVVAEPTCVDVGSKERGCSVCSAIDASEIEVVAHTYGDWETVDAATCTAKGSRSRTCSVCKYVATESVNVLGHSYGDWSVTTAATCTTKGVKIRKCSRCGSTETADVAITSHNVNAESGKCTICNAQIQEAAGLASLLDIKAYWSPSTGNYTNYAEMVFTNKSSYDISLGAISINGVFLSETTKGEAIFREGYCVPAHSTRSFTGIFSKKAYLTSDSEGSINGVQWNGENYYMVYFNKNGITSIRKDKF